MFCKYSRHGSPIFTAQGHEGGGVAETIALRSVTLGVAQLAVDLAIGGIAGEHRVQGSVALTAVVTALVPLLQGQVGALVMLYNLLYLLYRERER